MGLIAPAFTLPDGRKVDRITLAGHGLEVQILTLGVMLERLALATGETLSAVPDRPPGLALRSLGCDGLLVGRCANRILGGIEIGGQRHDLDGGREIVLHGGRDGAHRQVWTLAQHGPAHVTMNLRMPDGHMGFPGTLDVAATYRLEPDATLTLDVTATTDAETVCNFAQHSYFNLHTSDAPPYGDLWGHELTIAADRYMPTGRDHVPTGEVAEVSGTPFDFRTPRRLGEPPPAYDNNFCLSETRLPRRAVAQLRSLQSGITMTLETTEPGLQVYDTTTSSTTGNRVALEPQCWPDAPNRPWRAQAMLAPGETYHQSTAWRFERGEPG